MTTLNDTQLVLLSAAAQRDDHLIPLPDNLKGAAARKAGDKLVALHLAEEVTVGLEDPAWRTGENGSRIGLKVTSSGMSAIGLEPEAEAPKPKSGKRASTKASAASKGSGAPAEAHPRSGSKQALVISLLERKSGATLDEMVEATGWLPHTTRAALTGLRQKGFEIAKAKNADGKTVYSLPVARKPAKASPARGARS